MAAYNTIFSIGVRLRGRLLDPGQSEVGNFTKRICPVAAPIDLEKPFITFYRSGMDQSEVKNGQGPRSAFYHVQIYTDTWEEGTVIAEEVDKALGGFTDDGIRYCTLCDSGENFDPTVAAYVQILTYKVKPTKN